MSIQTRSSNSQITGTRLNRRSFVTLSAGLLVSTAFAGQALASDPLDAPRNAGTVGERFDGYAETRDGATGEDQSLVQSINQKRRAFYEQKAAEEGVEITAVQEIYAKAIYDKAPSGWWFLSQSGWAQK